MAAAKTALDEKCLSEPTEPTHLADALWTDACLALELATALHKKDRLPSFYIRAHSGPVLDAWLQRMQTRFNQLPMRRLPLGVSEGRLLGELDIHSTLAMGSRVYQPGLLERSSSGYVILPVANALDRRIAHLIATAQDLGDLNRDGTDHQKFGFVLIDEHEEGEDAASPALRDRAVFHLDLRPLQLATVWQNVDLPSVSAKSDVCTTDEDLQAICEIAATLGIASLRPAQQALNVAHAHAEMSGRETLAQDDFSVAFRLCLANRAEQLLLDEPLENDETDEPAPEQDNIDDAQDDSNEIDGELDLDNIQSEILPETVFMDLPPDFLAHLKSNVAGRVASQEAGRRGKPRESFDRGRPIASRRGRRSSRQRIDLLATLRAAAPWQKMRNDQLSEDKQIAIWPSDIHIKRYKENAETSTIFVVDASGSTALNRLGEAKGAVECLLAEGYANRDHVALLSFRDSGAQILLPPTRSLVRAKRCLANLAGGGPTPLAAGVQSALQLANEETRKGRMVSIVILTDGSANVALDGSHGRSAAMADCEAVAQLVGASGHATIVLDVSKFSNAKAKNLADLMRASYLPMPFTQATQIADAVRASAAR